MVSKSLTAIAAAIAMGITFVHTTDATTLDVNSRGSLLGTSSMHRDGALDQTVSSQGTYTKQLALRTSEQHETTSETVTEVQQISVLKFLGLIDQVWQIVNRNYLDATFNQVDWETLRHQYLAHYYNNDDETYDAIREMLETLDDPYTYFLSPEEFNNLQLTTSGELTGVGIQISQDSETGELVVISPIEDTPADVAGIVSRDVIIAIDSQSTVGMTLSDAINRIRGPVGSTVTLTIRRDAIDNDAAETLEFPITRARIEIHPVKYSYQQENGLSVGYIRLSQFNDHADEEMRDAIKALTKEEVDGFILDLRSNPGGLFNLSIKIARMWLDDGLIVSTIDRKGNVDEIRARGRAHTDKPLVILVDSGTASASEILAGALQDNGRATLVGTQTFGKGVVQNISRLEDGSGLALTVAKYLTPNGNDIHENGIAPDYEIVLTDDQRERLSDNRDLIGTINDPQYVKALEILALAMAGL